MEAYLELKSMTSGTSGFNSNLEAYFVFETSIIPGIIKENLVLLKYVGYILERLYIF